MLGGEIGPYLERVGAMLGQWQGDVGEGLRGGKERRYLQSATPRLNKALFSTSTLFYTLSPTQPSAPPSILQVSFLGRRHPLKIHGGPITARSPRTKKFGHIWRPGITNECLAVGSPGIRGAHEALFGCPVCAGSTTMWPPNVQDLPLEMGLLLARR